MGTYTLPDMPYDYGALEPAMSGQILELHHSKHHAAYVKGSNDALDQLAEARDKGDYTALVGLEKTLAFNLSGHVLHSIFWNNLSPDGGDRPDGELAAAIGEHFGSFDAFAAQLSTATKSVQGSGWGVLAWEPLGGRLIVRILRDTFPDLPHHFYALGESGPSWHRFQDLLDAHLPDASARQVAVDGALAMFARFQHSLQDDAAHV